MDNNFKTVDLDQPLKVGDKDVSKLKLRKPLAGELRGIKLLDVLQMDPDALAELVPRISEPQINKADFYSLEVSDLMRVISTTVSFFGKAKTVLPTK